MRYSLNERRTAEEQLKRLVVKMLLIGTLNNPCGSDVGDPLNLPEISPRRVKSVSLKIVPFTAKIP